MQPLRVLMCLMLVGFVAQAESPARAVLDAAGMSRGLCSVVSGPDPALAVDLAEESGFLVHEIAPDDAGVAAAWAEAAKPGLPLQRFVVERGGAVLPYADGIIDLLVVEDGSLGTAKGLAADFCRVLRPKGRLVVCKSGQRANIPGQWKEIPAKGGLMVLEKPPVAGVDNWTHWEHGADNNPVSEDKVIKAPYRTQWLGLPYYIAMPAITTAAGGRTFVAMGHIAHHEREEAWLNTILARNGYNGAELWRRRVPDGYLMHRSAFIATDDTFYMIDPDNPGCILLDPETGREKARITVPESGAEWKWMALVGRTLYALGGTWRDPAETTVVRSEIPAWSWNELSRGYYEEPRVPWGFGETIVAYDLDGQRVLWTYRETAPVDSRAMAIGEGKVFYYAPDARIGCLDAASGKVAWQNEDAELRGLINESGQGLTSTPGFRTSCYCVYTPEALFYEAQTQMNLVAVSKDDGRLLWHHKKTSSNPNVIFADGSAYCGIGPDGSTLELDPKTGEIRRDLGFKKRSCVRLTATPDSFFVRGWPEGVTRYDRATGKITFDGSMRPACNDGVIGANGLLYIGPWLCDCNLSIMGTAALASAPAPATARPASDRLELASTDCAAFKTSKQDWTTYRGNNDRTGSTGAEVEGPLQPLWTWNGEVAAAVTAPTAAGGLVFVAGDDGTVRTLDGATGNVKWAFRTAGPIMQPPTIWEGRAYAGSGDGFVYCLEASTGKLLWRFDASPVPRRIPVYGHLCSTWPVNSGVLVHDGAAYFAAGVIDYDGTYLYALDAKTGEVKWVNEQSGWADPALRKGVSAQGNLTVANGRLCMAGGNIVSPAEYDLDTGAYLGRAPRDGSPESNRGEEIGVMGGNRLVFGGRLRYSARENVVNPGSFALRLESGANARLAGGMTAPVWDEELVVLARDRESPPSGYATNEILNTTQSVKFFPGQKWRLTRIKECRTLALALAKNAAVAVCESPRQRDFRSRYQLMAVDRASGRTMFNVELDSAPRQNGLAIDSDGRVLLAMADGSVRCFGGMRALEAYLDGLAGSAGSAEARAEVIRRISGSLDDVHDQKERETVLARLKQLGVDPLATAKANGCVCAWKLLAPVPWNDTHPLDENLFASERVDTGAARTIDGEKFNWESYQTVQTTGEVDLAGIYGEYAGVAAYAYAEVELAQDGPVVLKVGSNDGYKCWFNGKEAGGFPTGRAYIPDQDSLNVEGRKGANTILIKVAQEGGQAWAFSVRVTDPAGKPVAFQDQPQIVLR
ncbi:MAG TPA: PQQ-binding-like beta-propeller repeat protein [Candidatus Bathyarchaeia archaeon]|nr:PQQ-binding-like beta-propeller repeat protein [Candidatus Bathyarchaeia archaeon]